MTTTAPPSASRVLLEQLRVLGLKLRPDFLLIVLVLALLTWRFLDWGRLILPEPEADAAVVFASFLLPLSIWRGERLFDGGSFWAMPVDRLRHAAVRAFAGWIWLMAAGAFTLAWLVGLAAATGGVLAGEEFGVLVPATAPQRPLPQGLARLPPVVEVWQCFAPFAAATAFYLAGSAFAIGLRRPAYGVAAVFAAVLVAVTVFPETPLTHALQTLVAGPLGLQTVFSGSAEWRGIGPLAALMHLLSDGLAPVSRWLLASALWIGGGAALLSLALWRHRER